ncbi:MAG TPA: tetratricopeptide repeat protein [Terracidiphilus sp.]|nr:tetratricopeptide repeat protein [Terracidiphilus sp.]
MTSYSRQDVQRILQISSRQLQGWERAGLIPQQQNYMFQDLGQLRILRALRQDDVPAASIRDSILAMKAVAGMSNPLLEARLVRTGTRLAFRHHGEIVDPIRRQLLFDFERFENSEIETCKGFQMKTVPSDSALHSKVAANSRTVQNLFLAAVQAEESSEKHRAIGLYHEILAIDPDYAPASINLGTLHFHLRQYTQAEEYYRRATVADPAYVLAYFDLGNVLDELGRMDEAITAYLQAVTLAPGYGDAHYNLALAYERRGQHRSALRHWQNYVRLDNRGPWAEHARSQIRKLLGREKLTIASRSDHFVPPHQGRASLALVG